MSYVPEVVKKGRNSSIIHINYSIQFDIVGFGSMLAYALPSPHTHCY